MFRQRVEWITVLVAGMVPLVMAIGASRLRAGGVRPEDAVAKLGLKRVRDVLVLDAESQVHDKMDEARRFSGQLSRALMQQRAMGSPQQYQAMLKELDRELTQLRAEVNATNQQMRQLPRGSYGRYSRYFANNLVAEQYAGLQMYQNQLQGAIQLRTYTLNQLKSQPPDPKTRQTIDTEVRDRREALHQAVVDLRRLVDTTREKYEKLAKDPQVKAAREDLERTASVQLKLGPSRQFENDVKLLEKLEKQDSGEEAVDATASPVRKNRRLRGGKRSSKATASPAAPGSSS
jgi:hypothetical protein